MGFASKKKRISFPISFHFFELLSLFLINSFCPGIVKKLSFWDFKNTINSTHPLRKKCPNTEYFYSVFSHIRTEYGNYIVNLLIQSEYGKIQTRKNSVFGRFSHGAHKNENTIASPINLSIIKKLIEYFFKEKQWKYCFLLPLFW